MCVSVCITEIETPTVREWPTFIFSLRVPNESCDTPSSHWSLLPLLLSYLSVSHSHILSLSPPSFHFKVRRNRVRVTLEERRNKAIWQGREIRCEDKSLFCLTREIYMRSVMQKENRLAYTSATAIISVSMTSLHNRNNNCTSPLPR